MGLAYGAVAGRSAGMGYGVRRGRGRAFGEPEAAEAGARSAPKLVPLTLNGNGHQTGVSSKAGQGSAKEKPGDRSQRSRAVTDIG